MVHQTLTKTATSGLVVTGMPCFRDAKPKPKLISFHVLYVTVQDIPVRWAGWRKKEREEEPARPLSREASRTSRLVSSSLSSATALKLQTESVHLTLPYPTAKATPERASALGGRKPSGSQPLPGEREEANRESSSSSLSPRSPQPPPDTDSAAAPPKTLADSSPPEPRRIGELPGLTLYRPKIASSPVGGSSGIK